MTRTEHLLVILAEECAEVAQRCSKALRFGLDEIQPGQEFTNAERIIRECEDMEGVLEMLNDEEHCVFANRSWERILEKKLKIEKFLKYSAQCGTLDKPK